MSKIRIFGLLCLCAVPALVAAPSAPIEVKLYVAGRFSAVCRSPDTSSLPYWSINGTVFDSIEVIRRYGADIHVDHGGDGHYLSAITIAAVNQTHNNSTISCTANMTYHLTVVETDFVNLDTEEFSAICINPSVISSDAPHFTYNGIPLNNMMVNEFYGAYVTVLPSEGEGHIRVRLEITGGNSTLNDSTVVCLVGSAVIWRVHLIRIRNESRILHTTTATVQLTTTTDDINQTIAMPESPESAASRLNTTLVSSTISAVLLLAVLGVAIVIIVVVVYYLYKRGRREPQGDIGDEGDIGGPPDANQLSFSPRALIPPAVQVVIETQGPPVNTEPVTVLSKREGTPRHVRTQSLLRYSDENSVTDPVDFSALDNTTSSFIYSFSNEGEEESERTPSLLRDPTEDSVMDPADLPVLAGEMVQLSKEEESKSEGRSLSCTISGLDCTNAFQTYFKGWDGMRSSRHCLFVADRSSDGHNNESQEYSAV